jgi:hypothetical protein
MAKAAEESHLDASSGPFSEIGQVPLPGDAGYALDTSGWLVLDSVNRRGYTFTEGGNTTIIQSFDLDTLKVRKRAVVPGIPISSGWGQEGGGTADFAGDIVHAVDPVAKRVYLPMSNTLPTGTGPDPDNQRMVSHVLVLDEAQFDEDPSRAFGAFSFPGTQQRLAAYPLLGMAVTRHHVAAGATGKLLAIFASTYQIGTAPVVFQPVPGPYDHTLVQWDPTDVKTGHAPAPFLFPGALPIAEDWEQLLSACATASMSSPESKDASSVAAKNYQWGILAARDAAYVGCQSAPQSGAVLRLLLDPTTGAPAVGANQQLVPLGKPVGDVLADPDGGRLYLRSFGGGATWWAFDTKTMRFAGAIAGHLTDGKPMAAGVDERTGRLYTLTPDTCALRQGGGLIPVRGGIKVTEARLDPVPAPENVRPDMTYNSWWRIHVDSVTRRVYIRRGVRLEARQLAFPECDLNKRADAPVERFFRVFEDRIPLVSTPAELDDALFTTDVPEAKGVTQASFVGSGTGYGARVVLTGGLDALTAGAVTTSKSLCGRDDRELLVGSVGGVEVSDQSTRAEASSLDADSRTQEAFGNPLNRCRQQAPSPQGDQLNRCQGNDIEELAFDERQPGSVDANKDGCPDRTGVNRYSAACIQDQQPDPVIGPSSSVIPRAVANPRHGFKASTKCEAANEYAEADAEGALASEVVDSFQEDHAADGVPVEPFRVGRSASKVTVDRTLGKGMTVTVDSIVRGIEFPGGTIGAIRAEATSTATGRDNRARGEFKRTICDVRVGNVVVSGCLGDEKQQAAIVKQINDALGGRAEVRLRSPDRSLLDGTPHGYLAAVQRDRKQLFSDQAITRDRSLAVPALEIVFFQGDGGAWGAGRQVLQLAGVQASTSYGIVCAYGQAANGDCAKEGEGFEGLGGLSGDFTGLSTDGLGSPDSVGESTVPAPNDKEPAILRLIKKIPEAIAEALRLLFNNPRELGLMAAVWGLLYAPCYLGERRRSIRGLHARRATVGGVG